ncbi:MAG: BtpA/SgcQ family protein [Synechococcaceae cyanobacterium RL_1_2]|nr:BtpA/SgcQ family protein [Synechococcaceae cyanobacterium RL_1_2]
MNSAKFNSIFPDRSPVIGVVHLLPLPTSPRWGGSLKEVIDRAEQEATALAAGGVDGIIVENFFDAPFPKDRVDPAVISAMTIIIDRLLNLVTIPIGINVLRNDGFSGLAIAAATQAHFIRVNILTGVMATDQGLIEGQAHDLLRYRRHLDLEHLPILADVQVKHAVPVGKTDLETAVHDTVHRGLADGVIISGLATGKPPSLEDLKIAKEAVGKDAIPVLVGSGADWDNVHQLMNIADGVIVASSLKRQGEITAPIDPTRVSQFVEMAKS